LLPGALRDPDGNEEERAGTISVFEGPAPTIEIAPDAAGESIRVADFLRSAIDDGIAVDEIGLFVRTPEAIGRARAALDVAGLGETVPVSVMHRKHPAKAADWGDQAGSARRLCLRERAAMRLRAARISSSPMSLGS